MCILPRGGTLSIGSDSVVLGNSFITNIDHIYEDISKSVLEQQCQVTDTQIGEGCFIGYGAAIQAGTTLGKHCIIGTNAVVRGNFPDYCVIVGAPGKIIRRYDTNTDKWIKS